MRRPKPHQLVVIVGVLLAFVLVPVSGILPRLTEWHDDDRVTRPDFINVPDPVYWMFYAVIAVALFACAWLIAQRVRNYERGKPDDRRTTKKNVHRRLRDFRAGVWMQTLLRDPAAGLMHSCIYFGFLVLFAATVILEINHQLPEALKFLHGDVYRAYAATADFFGVVFIVGIVWAIGRRY
ncbi:MAG: iron-sulfur protein, partial [Myxococcota bacterium]